MIKDQQGLQHKQEVIIRRAKKADAVAIARLLHELAAGEGRYSLQTAQTVAQDVLGKASRMQVLLADARGETVGMACYYPGYDLESASFGNHLADLVVTKLQRKRGIGTLLMQEVARHTLAAGGEWLSWTVLTNNRTAQKFYKEMGAQTIGLRFMALGAEGLQELAENQANQ